MKWDIDKALKALEDDRRISGTAINRVQISGETHALSLGVKFTAEEKERDCAHAWCLAVGILLLPKKFFYGRTIREAYLKARKFIKSASQEELTELGLSRPRRSNSFLQARKIRKKAA